MIWIYFNCFTYLVRIVDTTDPGNTAAQLNALLASLRAAGLLAT